MADIVPGTVSITEFNQFSGGLDKPEYFNPTDLGKNWKNLGVPNPGGGSGVVFSLENGIAVAAQSGGVPIRTTDYGATWFVLNTAIIIPNPPNGYAYLGNGIALLADNVGNIHRSPDFGITWSGIAVSASTIRTITYLGNGIVLATDTAVGGSHIWKSTDYGINWVDTGVVYAPASFYASAYLDNGIIIVGTGDGAILRSANNGLTWTNQGILTTATPIKVISAGNGVVVVPDSTGHVFRSTDAGLTWLNLGITLGSGNLLSGDYFGNGVIILGEEGNATNSHLFRSSDSGYTWTDLGNIILVVPGLASAADGMAYIGNGIGLIFDDGSEIWRSDVASKFDERQVNYPKLQVNQTALRNLDVTYTNTDLTRTLEVAVTVRCAITVAGGNAYVQGFSDDATPPVTAASGIVGIQAGLLNEDNSLQLVFKVYPGKKYIITTSATNGTVTKGGWFETYI